MANGTDSERRGEQLGPEGEDPNRIENERTGETGGAGDYGNQALWGHFANRQDRSHGSKWQWNWNLGRRRAA